VLCNGLANRAVKGYLEQDSPAHRDTSLLPLEKAVVFIDYEKTTTDVGSNSRYLLGAEEARRFYTSPVVLVRDVNKGGLGWSGERFQVAWTAQDLRTGHCGRSLTYLRLRLRKEVLREIHELLETPPSEVPPEYQYLLELDHSAMYKASYEEQAYWVLALKAAGKASRRAATSQRARGRSQRTRLVANPETRIRYDFRALEDQMGYELRRQKPGRKRPHLTSVSASVGSNKRLRKPD